MNLQPLPLHEIHEQHGASFCPVGGYEVPCNYRHGSAVEHLHTRKAAGLFDISYKAQIEISGPDANQLLKRLCPVDERVLSLSGTKYTFMLNENAGIIEHLVVLHPQLQRFILVFNGEKLKSVLDHIEKHSGPLDTRTTVLDHALLALQGPQADDVLASHGYDVATLPAKRCATTTEGYIISRSGYTADNGVEISLPAKEARSLVTRLIKDERVKLAGHTTRNSLRLEAGLCRYGYEIDEKVSPVEAGLLKVIPRNILHKGEFVGSAALKEKLAGGSRRVRIGLTPKQNVPLKEGATLLGSNDNAVGYISSTSHSPAVGKQIAMGYMHANVIEFGLPVFVKQDGKKIPLTRQPLPFLPLQGNGQ